MIYFKNEVGRVIYPKPLPFDITGYTITVYITKPDASIVTKSGTIVDAASGQISWTVASGNIDTVGEYFQQVKAVSGGTTRYGEAETFKVEAIIA